MKTLLVVGASSETAYHIWNLGKNAFDRVIMTSSNISKCKEIYGEDVVKNTILDMDFTSPSIKKVVSMLPEIDAMCYCAGILEFKPLPGITEDDINRTMEINVTGFVKVVRELVLQSKMKEGGRICAITSVGAKHPIPGAPLYTISKSALEGAVRALAIELASKKITVNGVSPGVILTSKVKASIERWQRAGLTDKVKNQEMRHIVGMVPPHEVAKMIVMLLSGDFSHITGTIINVDGGFSIS